MNIVKLKTVAICIYETHTNTNATINYTNMNRVEQKFVTCLIWNATNTNTNTKCKNMNNVEQNTVTICIRKKRNKTRTHTHTHTPNTISNTKPQTQNKIQTANNPTPYPPVLRGVGDLPFFLQQLGFVEFASPSPHLPEEGLGKWGRW